MQPQDTDTLIEIGELQVHQSGSGNKELLEKFKQVGEEGSIPYQSWNNLGAVLHKNGDIEGLAYRLDGLVDFDFIFIYVSNPKPK